jgi:hypothetical protein
VLARGGVKVVPVEILTQRLIGGVELFKGKR